MKRSMVHAVSALLLGVVLAACGAGAEAGTSDDAQTVPYKLGTFQEGGREFLGLVLNDTRVIDIARANESFEGKNGGAQKMTIPTDMKQLIAQYESGLRQRLGALAAAEVNSGNVDYAYNVDRLRILPPVRPTIILNGGGNYSEHSQGIVEREARERGEAPPARPVSTAVSAPGIWDRTDPKDWRDNPYLFLKSPSVVVGANDDVIVPKGRDRIDFECEFATVIGNPAKNVSVANAADYIFGYTIEFDVSDRGGRGDRKMGGSDWLVGKNHDTFGPIGPYIVPKEFHPNPMKTRHHFELNGETMQDSNTERMDHNIYELLSYASNILTLNPGDIIASGSPAGTNIERDEPRWMRAGDKAVCTIEGIGVQTHSIVAQK